MKLELRAALRLAALEPTDGAEASQGH